MVLSLHVVLLAICLISIASGQQPQDGRCDVTRDMITYTRCRNCITNRFTECPSGTTKTSTGEGINDCSYRFIFFVRPGCRHSCLSNVVVEAKCCDGYWGPNCDPCPGLNGATGECSGHGNCTSGIDGDGTCICEDSFNGTNCELCAEENVFGLECNSTCTCMNGECDDGPDGNGHCQPDTCEVGFVGEDCESQINTTACQNITCDDDNGYCVERPDGSTACMCIPDYHFDSNDTTTCIAIDHCILDTHNCDGNATCNYTDPNQYDCTCDEGFTGDGVFCEVIDPCQTDNGNCAENQSCIFEGPGMSSCECLEGYENTSSIGCSPINRCEDGTTNCIGLANCTYLGPGIARCDCPAGYTEYEGECYGSLLERLQELKEEYELDTFLMIIQEQGLEELLDRGGIFTVFAPINTAFEEDMSTFDEATTILAHIIPAEVTSLVSTPSIYVTLAGHVVEITPSRNYTIVGSSDSAGIIVSDLMAFNGLINIMEDVSVIPESARPFNISNNDSAWDFISSWDRLSQFSSFIQVTNMISDFGFANITVLAPTNEAFEALEPGALAYLQTSNGTHDLVTIISNHLVNEETAIADLVMHRILQTAENNFYPITLNANGSISLGLLKLGLKLIITDIIVSNGIVHVIDAVLKPPELNPIVNRTCPRITTETIQTACTSCFGIQNCPPGYENANLAICFVRPGLFIGCSRSCIRTVITPECCPGFYGTDCLPCPDNHVNPCNGNGQCQDRINGNGACMCYDGFDGASCEFCTEPDRFGANCTQNCTCINGICDNGPMGSGQCRPGSCEVGFIGDNCDVGIPHCGILNNTCHLRATCLLIIRTEVCTCRRGYRGDGIISCEPINRCQEPDRGGCHDEANCTYDGPGNYTCTCNSGWSGDGISCSVIDPCTLPYRGGCDSNALCRFTAPGENSCSCNFGYRGNGESCTAINSCEINRGSCHPQATCISTGPGINNCTCNERYMGDGYNCIGDLLAEIGNNPNVSMFYALLQQSHLDALLSQSDGDNYTVFIPSNMAITNASAMQYTAWTEEHALPLLIQHHLVAGVYSLENLTSHLGSLPTLLADDVLTVDNVSVGGNRTIVHINSAGIVLENFPALNGVYHIVDEVLFPDEAYLPSEPPLLVDLLSNLTNFTTLIELIKRFNITNMLNSNTFTVLAPTDDAFSEEDFDNLTKNDILYHLYPGALPVESIYKGLQLFSQLESTAPLTFDMDGNSTITVNDVPLLGNGYHASNSSIILPISGVLQPIFSRCDIVNVSTVNGTCRSCARRQVCPTGSTILEYQACTYTVTLFGFPIFLSGCHSVCEQMNRTPRCCDGFYGPDCDACPHMDGNICSGRGSCNDSVTGNGNCTCNEMYDGTACETCLPNMYGKNCNQECNCSTNGYCDEGVHGDGTCYCLPGWQGNSCDILVNSTICNSTCHEFAYCVEASGTCVCKEGYTGNGTYCSAIDMCVNNGDCDPMASCVADPTAPGGRTCTCPPSQYTGDGIVCLPLDSCIAAVNGGCDRNAKCVMTGPGLTACACNAGYTGDGRRSCDPINACELTVNGGCGANAYCMPTGPALTKCFCDENYVGDGYVCAGTLRQVIATHASLTTLNSYMNQQTSSRQPIGKFLNDGGVFTGFAISDTGYQALMNSSDNATLALFSDPDTLERLIQYSFVACTLLPAESLKNVSTLTSLMGSSLRLTDSPSGIMVNNISLSVENVVAANGIIHIIDTAIMPPSEELVVGDRSRNLQAVLRSDGFSLLQRGYRAAGSAVVEEIFNPSLSPFTVFAPVDSAFNSQLISFFGGLLLDTSRSRLQSFVEFHMISGAMLSPSDLSNVTHLVTVQGGIIRIECNQGDLFVNGNRVVLRQIPFNNGIIYGIDGVLMPPGEGGDCDVPTTLSVWTNCSGSCSFDCPGGYTPISNATSPQDCTLQGSVMGCRQLCVKSSFERRCCDGYYGSDCTACPRASSRVCNGIVSCDDGIDGVGCNCTAPYSGRACEGCIDGYTNSGGLCVPVTTSSSLMITSTSTTSSLSSPVISSSSSMTMSTSTTTSMSSSMTMTPTLISSMSSMTSSAMTSSSSMIETSSSMIMTSSSSVIMTSSSSVISVAMTTSTVTSSAMTSSSSVLSSSMSVISPTTSSSTTSSSSSSSSMVSSASSSVLSSSMSVIGPTTSSSTTTSSSSSSMVSSASPSQSSASSISMGTAINSVSVSQQPPFTTVTSSSPSTTVNQSGPSTIVNQTAAAAAPQESNNNTVGVAVGVSVGLVVLIVIVIIVMVIAFYMYSKKRGYLSFKDRMNYKTNDDGIILTMDSPSPIAYNNPLYSGPGDDSFLDSSTDNFMTNPIYDDVDDEM